MPCAPRPSPELYAAQHGSILSGCALMGMVPNAAAAAWYGARRVSRHQAGAPAGRVTLAVPPHTSFRVWRGYPRRGTTRGATRVTWAAPPRADAERATAVPGLEGARRGSRNPVEAPRARCRVRLGRMWLGVALTRAAPRGPIAESAAAVPGVGRRAAWHAASRPRLSGRVPSAAAVPGGREGAA